MVVACLFPGLNRRRSGSALLSSEGAVTMERCRWAGTMREDRDLMESMTFDLRTKIECAEGKVEYPIRPQALGITVPNDRNIRTLNEYKNPLITSRKVVGPSKQSKYNARK